MKSITMITTFYRGHQYLPRLVEMVRNNVAALKGKAQVEYLIINDSPWEKVDLTKIDCTDWIFGCRITRKTTESIKVVQRA